MCCRMLSTSRQSQLICQLLLLLLQDITKNFTESEAAAELGQLLQLPWSSATLVTLSETVAVQISRKGKAQVQVKHNKQQQQQQQGSVPPNSTVRSNNSSTQSSSMAASTPQQQQQSVSDLFSGQEQQQQQQVLINLQHDRVKAIPINGSVADPFLYKIGLQTAEGRIKANMQVRTHQRFDCQYHSPFGNMCTYCCHRC